jgi:hypothetical protein
MERIAGVSKSHSLLTALAFAWSQRRYGKVLQPLKIAALDRKLLLAFGHMECAQQRARQMSSDVKLLARSLAAMQVNCPWCLDFGLLESKDTCAPGVTTLATFHRGRGHRFTLCRGDDPDASASSR